MDTPLASCRKVGIHSLLHEIKITCYTHDSQVSVKVNRT